MTNSLDFEDLFPHDIISFSRLTIKSLSPDISKCKILSAIWKSLLIISKEEKIKVKEKWIPELLQLRQKAREPIKEKLTNEQISTIQIKISTVYYKIAPKLSASVLDKLVKTISAVILRNKIISFDFQDVDIIISWACRLYFHYSQEAIPKDGSPQSILLSKDDIIEDLILSLSQLIRTFNHFFKKTTSTIKLILVNQFKALLNIDPDLNQLVFDNLNEKQMFDLYSRFFETVTDPLLVPSVYSAIFAFPDMWTFHFLYYQIRHACLCNKWESKQMGNFLIDMFRWWMKIQNETRESQLQQLTKLLDDSIQILREKDDQKLKNLLKEFLLQVKTVVREEAYASELIPFPILVESIQK